MSLPPWLRGIRRLVMSGTGMRRSSRENFTRAGRLECSRPEPGLRARLSDQRDARLAELVYRPFGVPRLHLDGSCGIPMDDHGEPSPLGIEGGGLDAVVE